MLINGPEPAPVTEIRGALSRSAGKLTKFGNRGKFPGEEERKR
jgi:hypothetical protein